MRLKLILPTVDLAFTPPPLAVPGRTAAARTSSSIKLCPNRSVTRSWRRPPSGGIGVCGAGIRFGSTR